MLNFVAIEDLTCLKTKEWTPLEPGHVERKFYCSDGTTGAGRAAEPDSELLKREPMRFAKGSRWR